MIKARVLFVCIENSNRSQMAEAFSRMIAPNEIEAHSAGSRPSGKVNAKAIKAMSELGYDLSSHKSQSVDDFAGQPFDYVIGMGCGDACPHVPGAQRLEWAISDPRHLEGESFNLIRDEVRTHVEQLIQRIRESK